MKLNKLLYGGVLASAALVFASCGSDYLETSPSQYIEEDAVSEAMKKDPSQVKAYVTGALMDIYCGGDYWVSHDDFGLPAVKLATDLACEDIAYFNDNHFFCYDYQLDNRLGNYRRCSSMWNQFYNVISECNTIITMLKPDEGEQPSSTDVKIMLGEAYALRAYCYFWLVNLWQHPYSVDKNAPGVPINTETEYRQERVPVCEVYDQIFSDIELGYNYLKGEGFHDGKIGLSEYAAAGIYAEALMFTGDYAKAAEYAEIAYSNVNLNSKSDMLDGFNSLSMPEVIWGYNVTEETTGYYASLFSHIDSYMIGYGGKVGYRKLVASDLYDKIADTDVRKQWFGYNEDYNLLGINFQVEDYYGFDKYIQNKFRDAYMCGTGSPFTSAIIHMRAGEMYFVAAEANYLAGNESKAKTILNTIMKTRQDDYNFAGSGTELYNEICIQKRIETWMEGCRYLDAKRRGETIDRSTSVNHSSSLSGMNAVTYSSRDYRMIYRIPTKEIENNPEISDADDNE